MRIAEVRVDTVEIPFREAMVSGAQRWERRGAGLVTLVTDDGASGLGEMAPGPGLRLEGTAAGLEEALAGCDPGDADAVEAALRAVDAWPSVGRAARSAAESALVDLLARVSGRSVSALLCGEPAAAVTVNATLGIGPPEAVAARAAGLVAAGFGCLKLKAGDEPAEVLVRRLGAVRETVGPDVAIRLDFNGALPVGSAEGLLAAVAHLDIEYAEQPLSPAAGAEALARLRWVGAVPIAADESVRDRGAARVLLETGAVDALVIKPARVGGLRQASSIMDLATAAGVPVTVSTLFETGVGIAGALHLAAASAGSVAHGLATAELLESDLLTESLALGDGRMVVPTGAGLGVELDRAAVERYRVS